MDNLKALLLLNVHFLFSSCISCTLRNYCTVSCSTTHTLTHSELAGLFLIDPAAETLFEANSDANSQSQNSIPQDEEELEKSEFKTPWSHYWYRKTVPHLQSVHMSGSLGFNRLGLMVGLMSALEVPELQTILTDDVIAIKVSA